MLKWFKWKNEQKGHSSLAASSQDFLSVQIHASLVWSQALKAWERCMCVYVDLLLCSTSLCECEK